MAVMMQVELHGVRRKGDNWMPETDRNCRFAQSITKHFKLLILLDHS